MTADRYGGTSDLGVFEGTGFFRLAMRGKRHTLITPEGNGFWLRACYGVDVVDGGQVFVDTVREKYRSHPTSQQWGYWFAFAENASRYLKAADFNAIGEYSANYVWPIDVLGRGRANAEKLPFIAWSNVALYSRRPPYLVKDIQFGVDNEVTPGLWRVGGFPDVFDPMFERAYNDSFGHPEAVKSSPWLLGVSLDDRDYLFGFGPSQEFGGWHHHLGWIAAATRPRQTDNPNQWVGATKGVRYTDQTVYTKLALRDWLRSRYDALSAFNLAWGSAYTTWDSEGWRWPDGKGFLDESGRSAWLGRDFYGMKGANPAVRRDLDEFVGVIADRYFSVATTAVRTHLGGHLVFGPMPISPTAHPQILKAAGRWCDALQFNAEGEAAWRRGHSLTGKPFFVWTTFMAQADSPLAGKTGFAGVDYRTQEERGRAYAAFVKRTVAFEGSDGGHPCIGLDWWAYCDKVTGGEAHNFGIVTVRDNPYDGRAARRSRGVDTWGNPVGGEARDYGDFLTSVRTANSAIPGLVGQTGPRGRQSSSAGLAGPLALLAATTAASRCPTRRDFVQMLLGGIGGLRW